ncbi:hypothetical protein [Streptacidiphilus albus]|jgi:hypothetical protein|uniref:hypothetical protein n=1 Tax=Streptacidiphilus albus TaxID=105425 RepID=UPI00054BE850|nr:hypothetical protein [Streptacidiphilus albus]
MRTIQVVRAAGIPYGGCVYVHKEQEDAEVVLLDRETFTEADASIMAERLQRDPSLLVALGVAVG